MDNRVFNINGESKAQLLQTIILALDGAEVDYYKITKKGFVIYWSNTDTKDVIKLPVSHTADMISEVIFKWLLDSEPENFDISEWDSNANHDGHNGRGWRVYTEDWGQLGEWQTKVAVLPVWLWYGK